MTPPNFAYIIIFFLLSLCTGCFPPPSETDIAKLNLLKNKYGDNFRFKLIDETYLKVELKKDIPVNENDLKEIYKLFFFESKEDTKRRNTSFVYLNFYDSRGNFQYQIVYEKWSNKFVKSKTREYY
ncbi:MAG: hypothetical protein A2W05_00975 [Candidatus Schekmanbacteria bacterium RBG_16_38_10]|uniref:Uncharacterized protein n=1 Tax=Candidatus Schekmanbacteria bacterium RBG_16_38_10 TaxID=1817879 RepID=A0A1F7S0M5_9BACT|nr:MAG: hypothetical protein A2W05_00975 [Candidatus Schekmanbacteria bacterium RBG_16_38_10]